MNEKKRRKAYSKLLWLLAKATVAFRTIAVVNMVIIRKVPIRNVSSGGKKIDERQRALTSEHKNSTSPRNVEHHGTADRIGDLGSRNGSVISSARHIWNHKQQEHGHETQDEFSQRREILD